MKTEIIAIGNEVLAGLVVNSNAAYLSTQLIQENFTVTGHSVLPDDPLLLKRGLLQAMDRCPLIICTGGLGPTCDDITRAIVAEIFDSDFHYDDEIAQELYNKYGNYPTIRDQATVPSKAKILKNKFGTAPGLIFQNNGNTMILLPGVPTEMRAMFDEEVLPFLHRQFNELEKRHSRRVSFFKLPEAFIDPILRKLKATYPDVQFGIYPSLGVINVVINAFGHEKALKEVEEVVNHLNKQFSDHVFESETGKLEDAIHHLFIKKQLTLTVAESCTGGNIAEKLTKLSGASQYFKGGIVAYSNELKTILLDVRSETIDRHGAVSSETAKEMVIGLLSKTKSDFGLAVTGIAGPSGGTIEKPVGTVWFALKYFNAEPIVWKGFFHGNREMIIDFATNEALANLLQWASKIK